MPVGEIWKPCREVPNTKKNLGQQKIWTQTSKWLSRAHMCNLGEMTCPAFLRPDIPNAKVQRDSIWLWLPGSLLGQKILLFNDRTVPALHSGLHHEFRESESCIWDFALWIRKVLTVFPREKSKIQFEAQITVSPFWNDKSRKRIGVGLFHKKILKAIFNLHLHVARKFPLPLFHWLPVGFCYYICWVLQQVWDQNKIKSLRCMPGNNMVENETSSS